jgi:tetratricopeptide (TPR) repeat protein
MPYADDEIDAPADPVIDEVEISEAELDRLMKATELLADLEGKLNDLEIYYNIDLIGKPLDEFHKNFALMLEDLFNATNEYTGSQCRLFEEIVRRVVIIADYELEFEESPETDEEIAHMEDVRNLRKLAYMVYAVYAYHVNKYNTALTACRVITNELDYKDEFDPGFMRTYMMIQGCSYASLENWEEAIDFLEDLYHIEGLDEDIERAMLPAYGVTLHSMEHYGEASKVYKHYLEKFGEQSDTPVITGYAVGANDESKDCFKNMKMQF